MNKIKKTSIIILYISISLLLVKSINQYVVKTDYFEIKKINIKGNNFVKDETIYKLINNKINHNILDLDLKKLKSKINKIDLISNGLVQKNDLVKILSRGEITMKIDITADAFSKSAKLAIEKLGGSTNLEK